MSFTLCPIRMSRRAFVRQMYSTTTMATTTTTIQSTTTHRMNSSFTNLYPPQTTDATTTTATTGGRLWYSPALSHIRPQSSQRWFSTGSTSSSGTDSTTTTDQNQDRNDPNEPPNESSSPPNTDSDTSFPEDMDETLADDDTNDTDGDADPEVVVEDPSVIAARKQSQQMRDMKEALLRSMAEQENTRTIAKRDVDQARQYAIKNFAKSLLDVADNLQRALDAVPQEYRPTNHTTTTTESSTTPLTTIDPNIFKTLYEGIEMTEKGLKKALESHGVVQYGTVGDVFDPNQHEALMEYPDDTKINNTIGIVMKCGYTLHARVLRPAEVGLVKSKLLSLDPTTTTSDSV